MNSVYSLNTQINRLKAAVAIAGLTDLTRLCDQFMFSRDYSHIFGSPPAKHARLLRAS